MLRLFSQCREAESNVAEALRRYREAIALDPKIGLKRNAEQLSRDAASGTAG